MLEQSEDGVLVEEPREVKTAGQTAFNHEFEVAFQPAVDTETGEIVIHEALVRAEGGRGANRVLRMVTPRNQRAFDQAMLQRAFSHTAGDGLNRPIAVNIDPRAMKDPQEDLIEAFSVLSDEVPADCVVMEINETTPDVTLAHLKHICRRSRQIGVRTMIDDFGAGIGGLSRLSALRPSFIKLDMFLVRGIDSDARRRAIVASITGMALDLGIEVIAKCVETAEEVVALQDCGIDVMQGNHFCPPLLGRLAGMSDLNLEGAC